MPLPPPKPLTIDQAAREYHGTCGIYRIEHLNTGTVYIGQSVDVGGRLYQHLYKLRTGTHPSPRLQQAWNLSSDEGWEADLHDSCTPTELDTRETKALRLFSKALTDAGEEQGKPFNDKNRFRRGTRKPKLGLTIRLRPSMANSVIAYAKDAGCSPQRWVERAIEMRWGEP